MVASGGRILVIRGGAIGDFILTLPVLAALREHFPQTRIEVLGYPHIVQLASAGGLADEVQAIEGRGLASFFARDGSLPEEQMNYFSRFALIISYLYDPDRIFQANVARCSTAQFITGPHKPDDVTGGVHATEVFLKPLERLAIFAADPTPRLRLASEPASAGVTQQPDLTPPVSAGSRWLAVHPGSGSDRKNWPEENWGALLRRLAETTNLNLLLAGGEAELDRLDRLARLWPLERLRVARRLPLVDLGRWLSACTLFVGHDSGITHLAAAVGLRGLALWGETNEAVWRPRSTQIEILRAHEGLCALSVEQVHACLLARLSAKIDL